MKKKDRFPLFWRILFGGGILFIVFTFSTLFIQFWKINVQDFIFEAFQVSTYLNETLTNDSEIEELPEGVLAYGFYNQKGHLISGQGDLPLDIYEGKSLPRQIEYHFKDGNLYMYRPIGLQGMMQMMPQQGRTRREIPVITNDQARLLYIILDSSAYKAKQALSIAAFVLIGLFMTALVLLVSWLVGKNKKIQDEMESRKQLVQLGEAARTLAHEIKNPLGAMRVQTAILKKIGDQTVEGNIEIIDEELIRVSQLVDRVGDFLRQPLGLPENLDIEKEIQNIEKKGLFNIEVFKLGSNRASIVFIDRMRFVSVLENLLKNATEAAPDSMIRVEINAEKAKNFISIMDHGPGIDLQHKKQIFEPFFTTKDTGTGIGLSIAQRFIKAAGGELEVYTQEGWGGCFRISLPRGDK